MLTHPDWVFRFVDIKNYVVVSERLILSSILAQCTLSFLILQNQV